MDYIKDIVLLVQIMDAISVLKILFIVFCIMLCILTWHAPKLLRLYIEYKDRNN